MSGKEASIESRGDDDPFEGSQHPRDERRPSRDELARPSNTDLRQLVIDLGSAMVAAGDAVDNVEESLRTIVAAYGVTDIQIALLPTSLFVETGSGRSSHVRFSSHVAPPLRLDQIGDLYELVKVLKKGMGRRLRASKRSTRSMRSAPPSGDRFAHSVTPS